MAEEHAEAHKAQKKGSNRMLMIVAAVVVVAVIAVVAGRYLLSTSTSFPTGPTSTNQGALPATILGFSQNTSQTQYATAAGLSGLSKALNDTMNAAFVTEYTNATLDLPVGGLAFTSAYKAEAYALYYYNNQTTSYQQYSKIIPWAGLNANTHGWTQVYTYANLTGNATLYDFLIVNGSSVCQVGLVPRAMNGNATAPKFFQNVPRAQAQTIFQNASAYCFAAMSK